MIKMVKVSEYFNVVYGTNLELNKLEKEKNGIPFVSRTSQNNGVSAYVKKLKSVKPNPANTISVAAGGSVMSSFLQKNEYYSGRDVYYLEPKIDMNDNELLYYCLCLSSNAYKYNYGRQANKTLDKIKIPKISEIPVWVYELEIPKKPEANKINDNKVDFSTNKWKWFLYKDVFNIERGEAKYKKNMNQGMYPYISTTSKNNGVSAYVDEFNNYGNKITLSYDGTIGEAFYQKDPFFASEKIAVLDLKNYKLNKFIAMFIITLIRLEKYRFNYGLKWAVRSRMMTSKIKLPVNKAGNPDWDYMEEFIKTINYSKGLINIR